MTSNILLSDDELNSLRLQWEEGKSRGIEIPLEASKLGSLIQSGKLRWEQLSQGEREALVSLKSKSDGADSGQTAENLDPKILEVAKQINLVVEGMQLLLKKKLGSDGSKESIIEAEFKQLTGLSSHDYKKQLLANYLRGSK